MGDVIRFPRQYDDARPSRQGQPAPPPAGHEPLWREAVGEVLRDRRRQSGRTIKDVASDAGISMQYLSEIERGLKEPSSEMLAAVTGALGLDLASLTAEVTRSLRGLVCLAA